MGPVGLDLASRRLPIEQARFADEQTWVGLQ
jgi:hypothetical protein